MWQFKSGAGPRTTICLSQWALDLFFLLLSALRPLWRGSLDLFETFVMTDVQLDGLNLIKSSPAYT